jgi:hypothetical protein
MNGVALKPGFSSLPTERRNAGSQAGASLKQAQFGKAWTSENIYNTFGNKTVDAFVVAVISPIVHPITEGAKNLGMFVTQKIVAPVKRKLSSLTAKNSKEEIKAAEEVVKAK